MGAIVGALSRSGRNVCPLVQTMLEAMKHRGGDSVGVALPSELRTGRSLSELGLGESEASVVLAHRLAKILPKDTAQPIARGDLYMVLEGRVYGSGDTPDVEYASRLLSDLGSLGSLSQFVRSEAGSYVLALANEEEMTVARDPIGMKALYYGGTDDIVAFASERKALWRLGISDVRTLLPGSTLEAGKDHVTVERHVRLQLSKSRRTALASASERLRSVLDASMRQIALDLSEVGVAFSGGLDSSVTAKLAQDAGLKVNLLTVALEGQEELDHAERASRELGLPLLVRPRSPDEVESYVRRVLWLIEEPNLMKLSVAIPLHWAAELCSSLNIRVMLVGQGGDELFGGYARFARILGSQGRAEAEAAIFRSIADAHEINYQRDEQATAVHKVELRSPFAHPDVVSFAITLPLEHKVKSPGDRVRKHVLRRAALELGIPDTIALRPKRAIQHATGVEKAIRNLARQEGLKVDDYLTRQFNQVKQEPSPP